MISEFFASIERIVLIRSDLIFPVGELSQIAIAIVCVVGLHTQQRIDSRAQVSIGIVAATKLSRFLRVSKESVLRGVDIDE